MVQLLIGSHQEEERDLARGSVPALLKLGLAPIPTLAEQTA